MELTDHDLKDMAARVIVEDLIVANTLLKLSLIGNILLLAFAGYLLY